MKFFGSSSSTWLRRLQRSSGHVSGITVGSRLFRGILSHQDKVSQCLLECRDKLTSGDFEVFDGLEVNGIDAWMATNRRIQMRFIEYGRQDGCECLAVTLECRFQWLMRGDRLTKREIVQVTTHAVVREMHVVAFDRLVIRAGIFNKLCERHFEQLAIGW